MINESGIRGLAVNRLKTLQNAWLAWDEAQQVGVYGLGRASGWLCGCIAWTRPIECVGWCLWAYVSDDYVAQPSTFLCPSFIPINGPSPEPGDPASIPASLLTPVPS